MKDSISTPQRPLVSFIITYYNLPVQMLCECIDSILSLSLSSEEREIIVIDDGSDISPINGLMHYSEDIIYVRQKNGGVSIARNTGLNMAKGQYIQIVDGDDYLFTSPYEHCLDIVRQHQDADVVIFDFTHKTTDDTTYSDAKPCSGTEHLRNHNIRGTACCMMFRQSTRGQLAFTPNICYGEDEEFTPQLLLRAECVYTTNAKAYYYRIRTTSAVHKEESTSKQQRLNDNIKVIKGLNKLADRLPINDRLAIQRRVAQLTMDYIYNTIMFTRSQKELEQRVGELRREGLFPLPDKDYTQKYTWFRRMTNTRLGRTVLLNTLPLLRRER